ncbi:hypothetical protein [Vibrio diabolicus]|uniref:hypothetical protein n=1 Tax=Vibrio diabolicus TaxID=50719 RepID=UPI00211A9232|nr:hypothetical protein [Vibrio diabolicus]MCQ9067096.1 hypothetical protein [Vibrio diabolicus]
MSDNGLYPEQKLFNKLVDVADNMLNKGVAALWFSWIEWTGLTGLLFVAFEKTKSISALIAALISSVLLFFVAVAGCRRFFIYQLELEKSNKWVFLAAVALMYVGPMLAINIIKAVLAVANV